MSGKFKFSGFVEVTHLNTRKEGPDEEKELAVDLKVVASGIDAYALDFFSDALRPFLWIDAGGAVRSLLLGPLQYGYVLEDYRLDMLGAQHYGVKVKKFAITPRDGFVIDLAFQISFKPTGSEVARLAEYLQEAVEITLEPATQELDLDGPGDKMAELNDRLSELMPDEAYFMAKEIVRNEGRASISLVQRHLRIGYNHAARLIEQMEKEGIVSAPDSKGARTVL